MTLFKVLHSLFKKYQDEALSNVGNDEKYYESLGRMRMCNELSTLLTLDSLLMDVDVKTEVLLRGK